MTKQQPQVAAVSSARRQNMKLGIAALGGAGIGLHSSVLIALAFVASLGLAAAERINRVVEEGPEKRLSLPAKRLADGGISKNWAAVWNNHREQL